MVIQNKTILITGGGSGIGFQAAKVLASKQNKVIICGRSIKRLEEAKALVPELITYECDISESENCKKIAAWIATEHPDCSILINNAAIVHRTNFFEDDQMLSKADLEIRTNLLAPIHLCKHFLPLLARHPHGKIPQAWSIHLKLLIQFIIQLKPLYILSRKFYECKLNIFRFLSSKFYSR